MLLIPYALALPSVDQPVVTNVKNTTDAAVVVGIGDYLRVEDVPYADADATTFAAFAQQTLGIPASRVWRPSNRNKENIEKAVEEAGKKVGRGGTVWVYFAGHGAADPTTKERLLLGDDVPNDGSYASRGVSLTQVEKLAGAGGAKVIVVSDVCYTGQFRSLVLDPPKPAGAVIEWSATQKGEVAAPLAGTEHGAFTYLMLGALRGWADGEPAVEGAAREPADGVVTAREARDYVERQLAALQMRSQVPVMEAGDGQYELTLVKGVREAAPVLGASSVATTTGFGDLSLDVTAKVRRQACDQEALRLGAAARTARLDAEAKKAATEASTAWKVLSIQAKACEALDATSRADCAKTVDAFVARAAALKVTLPAGEEVVTTQCGSARPAFAAESRVVSVAELAEAKGQSGRLKSVLDGPVTTAVKAAVQAPTITPAASPVLATSPLVDTGTPGFGDEVVLIPAGMFTMGTPASEKDRDDDEAQHPVTLSSFLIARTEVSEDLWMSVTGRRSRQKDYTGEPEDPEHLPVLAPSWCEVVDFANRLSKLQGLTEVYGGVSECVSTKGASVTTVAGATGWRLPTEAEWEYAARAGTTGPWGEVTTKGRVCATGNVADTALKAVLPRMTVHPCDDGHHGRAPVGSYSVNAWGLYDVMGNLTEWTSDWYGVYPTGAVTDPVGVPSGAGRVLRGSSWEDDPSSSRLGDRTSRAATVSAGFVGARLARSLPSTGGPPIPGAVAEDAALAAIHQIAAAVVTVDLLEDAAKTDRRVDCLRAKLNSLRALQAVAAAFLETFRTALAAGDSTHADSELRKILVAESKAKTFVTEAHQCPGT